LRAHKVWPPVPAHQPDVSFSQANPVQDQWYTVLDTRTNVRILHTRVMVLAAGETVEVMFTADDNILFGSAALNAGAGYYVHLSPTLTDGLVIDGSSSLEYGGIILEARVFKAEIRKTTNNGAGDLRALLKWARW